MPIHASICFPGACIATALALVTAPLAASQTVAPAPAPNAVPAQTQTAPAPPTPQTTAGTITPPAPAAQPSATAPDFQTRIKQMLSAAWLADLYPFTRDADISDEGYEAGLALSKLDPFDDAVRLSRIADAIEAHPTADARVRAYESILAPQNRASLGAPVAARLAYQLASLQSRIGNTELFSRWLAEAVKADPSYPTAAQAAAGYFRMRVADAAADIELLSIAVEANPRDLSTWSALLSVLLDGGAFKAAERTARMAIAVAEAERRNELVYSFTGDLATALWGSGQREEASHELDLRMNRLTEDYRRIISLMDPSITNERLAREFPPLPSTLSIAMLGLAQKEGDTKKVDSLLERALRGTDAEVKRAEDQGASKADVGSFALQRAVTLLLFSKNLGTVSTLLDDAVKSGALGEQGKARFDAMLAWRQGKPEAALKALEPLRANDPLAQYAYASALADAKQTATAITEFRTIAETHIGTSIGLLALDRLSDLLGQPKLVVSQLAKSIADGADLLNKALADHLSSSLDEIIDHPFRALTVEIKPSSTLIGPYEPFTFNIRIRNSSRLPMAIGGDSPISGKVTMRSAAPRPGQTDAAELPPQPLLIDRRLRLMPGEEILVTVDADLTVVGLILNVQPLDSHLINVSVVSNPSTASGGLAPGFLGSVTGSVPIQFTGININEAWVKESRALVHTAGNIEAVTRLALLIHAASDPTLLPESIRGDSNAIWTDIVDAWKAMPESAQAWILGVIPQDTPSMAPLLDAAHASTSPVVLRSWAISRVVDPKDPMLDVCRRSGDAELSKLADAVQWVADRRSKRAGDEVGLETERARSMPKDNGAGSGR
ncbi:MAG: hypothetical protein NT059_04210 [Planctomycetota bacterium]|nr:hypothetical protein [Planctomycetota bacterium]